MMTAGSLLQVDWRRTRRRDALDVTVTTTAAAGNLLKQPLPLLLQRRARALQPLAEALELPRQLLVAGPGLLQEAAQHLGAAVDGGARALDLVVEGHVGEDVVEEHVAHEAAVVDADGGQVADVGGHALGLHDEHAGLLGGALGALQGAALHHVGHGAAAEHVHARVAQGVVHAAQRVGHAPRGVGEQADGVLLGLGLAAGVVVRAAGVLRLALAGVLVRVARGRAGKDGVVERVEGALGPLVAGGLGLERPGGLAGVGELAAQVAVDHLLAVLLLQHVKVLALLAGGLLVEPVALADGLVGEAAHDAVAVLFVVLELLLAPAVEGAHVLVRLLELLVQVGDEPALLGEVGGGVVRVREHGEELAVADGRLPDFGFEVRGHGGDVVMC
ncbi:hypothetical protein CTA2_6083 [Colletotrichum tanaceti]|nr:hypothetical protein CTA2_6083 [Colletotrichum tanaceti]